MKDVLLNNNSFNGCFKNGYHLSSESEYCAWFRKFLKKIEKPGNFKAGFTRRRDKVKLVKCIGIHCRGRKKFRSYYLGEHLCKTCRIIIRKMRPLRIQRIGGDQR